MWKKIEVWPAGDPTDVCVRQFNEWEPVTHQSGVLIVLS